MHGGALVLAMCDGMEFVAISGAPSSRTGSSEEVPLHSRPSVMSHSAPKREGLVFLRMSLGQAPRPKPRIGDNVFLIATVGAAEQCLGVSIEFATQLTMSFHLKSVGEAKPSGTQLSCPMFLSRAMEVHVVTGHWRALLASRRNVGSSSLVVAQGVQWKV